MAEDLTGDDLSDVLELHSDASAWWVLPRDGHYAAVELREVAKALDLDQLAIKDLLAQDRRVKFESIGQARLVITNAVSVDRTSAALSVHPVSAILTDRALICLVTPTDTFKPEQLLFQQEEVLALGGVEAGLQMLMTAVINTYEDVIAFLEDASDDLANALFEERPLNKDQQLYAFRLRNTLSQLRRVTDPMRTVMTDIVENPPAALKGKATSRTNEVTRRWSVISEHQTRVANSVDGLREVLAAVFDTSLSLADLRMNQIMKKLTGWAAILAVPTLVTGFVGMNVGFPLNGTMAGFWVYLALMLVASLVLFILFRRKDWV